MAIRSASQRSMICRRTPAGSQRDVSSQSRECSEGCLTMDGGNQHVSPIMVDNSNMGEPG